MNDTTLFIHQIIGPILVVFALSMLMNKSFYMELYKEIGKINHYLIIGGIINLSLGMSIILKHNMWSTAPEIVASVFGWLALLKGLHITLAPKSFMKMVMRFVSPGFIDFGALFLIILGGYMSYVGYSAW